jgi:hypothetical protein
MEAHQVLQSARDRRVVGVGAQRVLKSTPNDGVETEIPNLVGRTATDGCEIAAGERK